MRAIVLTAPGAVEVVHDWPEPQPAVGEVLVGIRAVGLCGSDLGVYEGHRPVPELPWLMGHEGGGEIVAVGAGVTDRHVGQRVVVEPNYPCLACAACLAGRTSACPDRGIVGMNVPGLLAERVAVPARFARPVPESVSDETLACLEPLAVARAAVRRSGVEAGDECLVIGAGSQGLLLCQALLAQGVRAFVTEPHPGRLALAERLGAKRADPDDVRGFPVVVDTAGNARTWGIALQAVAATGSIVMVGMGDAVSVSTTELARRQLVIRGSLIYDHPGDFADTVAAVADGVIVPGEVLQRAAGPEQAAEAFAQARSAPGKSWIDLTGWQEDRHG
ncbi:MULTISPECIES: zinc-dependent alcohol dehydrogenase [Prauserella salsuginis group]|uniref:Zinc-binding dehydrogenase n=1 Tax=Prauserella salsuginis TaxID=387889 RepID=A0ABW6G126_9PSEU|nr:MULTISPECIES: alcohol dehydrogenase catalytic domain-containing protein [Prauserella salsuginis group]MCR3722045.1 alcohol dehydrogenase [Prauserella flava]MCR3732626.1 alcohol dehydrogenase [Prauserella salsuginis]